MNTYKATGQLQHNSPGNLRTEDPPVCKGDVKQIEDFMVSASADMLLAGTDIMKSSKPDNDLTSAPDSMNLSKPHPSNKESLESGSREKKTRKRKAEPVSSSNDPLTFNCKICNKEFLSKAGAKSHEKYQHADAKLFCLVCKKSFKFHYDLDRHMKTHTGHRPFECQDCEKAFVCKSSLMQHVRLKHIVGNIYSCMVCDKSFCTEADLKRHAAIHTESKPYKCDKCMKTFTCKSSLNVHRRSHGEKKYACCYCNMHFHFQSDLTRHVTVHTGDRPWRCSVCDKGYSCKSTLSVHLKQVHTDTPTADMYVYDPENKQKDSPSRRKNKTVKGRHSSRARDTRDEESEESSDDDHDELDGDSDTETEFSEEESDEMQDIAVSEEERNEIHMIGHNKAELKRTQEICDLIDKDAAKMKPEPLEDFDLDGQTANAYKAIDALNKETQNDGENLQVTLYKTNRRGRKSQFVRKLEISDGCVLMYKS